MRLAAWLALWPLALAAQPRMVSGKVESAAAGANLGQQIRTFAGPAWVGYAIDAVPAERGCCLSINNGVCSMGCALEGRTMTGASCPAEQTAFLEGERTAHILFRVDKGDVERVRVFSPSCQIDIAGLTLHWLTGVRAGASVGLLRTLTAQRNRVSAIAAHADPVADAFLRETAESVSASRTDRDRAAHALAATRGPAGLAIVKKLLDSDADERFRESLAGAVAQAPGNAGTGILIDLSTKDKNRRVKERAFFWLGRSKDPRAQKFVEEILAR